MSSKDIIFTVRHLSSILVKFSKNAGKKGWLLLTYITVSMIDRVFFFERDFIKTILLSWTWWVCRYKAGQSPPTLLNIRQEGIRHIKFWSGTPFEMDIYYITLFKKKKKKDYCTGFVINTLEVPGCGRNYFDLLFSVMTEERKYFFEWRWTLGSWQVIPAAKYHSIFLLTQQSKILILLRHCRCCFQQL